MRRKVRYCNQTCDLPGEHLISLGFGVSVGRNCGIEQICKYEIEKKIIYENILIVGIE